MTQPPPTVAARAPSAPPAPPEPAGGPAGGSAERDGGRSRVGAKKRDRTPAAAAKPPRTARLRLTRVDPWSAMKTSFLLAIAFGIVTFVSVAIVWSVLGAAGVWDSINQTVQDVVGGEEASGFDVNDYLGTSRVLGFTAVVAAVDVVLITAMATLAAFLYNLAAALLGGFEVTLAEDS